MAAPVLYSSVLITVVISTLHPQNMEIVSLMSTPEIEVSKKELIIPYVVDTRAHSQPQVATAIHGFFQPVL